MKNEARYIHQADVHNLTAPRKIVPLIMNLFNPNSVLDIGCGIGTWLAVFKEHGVKEAFGVDGSYVNLDLLQSHIESTEFSAHDLAVAFDLNKRFDIAICLEVAEHIDKSSATTFIENVCKHSSVIIFSAAVPFQGGQNHVNEQWPEYWTNIFSRFGYECYDILRPKIWDDQEVDWWYKQNMLVFSNEKIEGFASSKSFLSIIHPEHFRQKVGYIDELNKKSYDNNIKLEGWESGSKGLRYSWNCFLRSVLKKITKSHQY
ncbi:MAG: class I SAM-dependent methyltransferase [Ferruginibacter sp.]